MQISSRFTVALHIFTCVDTFKDDYKVTSDFLASSINTNPVIIRKILTQLKRAGLINVARGTGGIELTRDLSEITFLTYMKRLSLWKMEICSDSMKRQIRNALLEETFMHFRKRLESVLQELSGIIADLQDV